MSQKEKSLDNIIRVNFKQKKRSDIPDMQSLYPDAFAMYVDTKSKNPDPFSRAVLDMMKDLQGPVDNPPADPERDDS
ncbi:MAG: hypothetical protein D3926_24280 [Desulfobacteraceae bacterium]|nr:MAG: hypothetical protein D3926_24280 [Desulfobacteraceae bacterium]